MGLNFKNPAFALVAISAAAIGLLAFVLPGDRFDSVPCGLYGPTHYNGVVQFERLQSDEHNIMSSGKDRLMFYLDVNRQPFTDMEPARIIPMPYDLEPHVLVYANSCNGR